MSHRITQLFIILAALPLCAVANDIKSGRNIEVVVHRGANALAPENTVASADSALAHGAKWIEVDVRSSKDGVMYNLHDDTLDRTTDGKGNIADWLSTDIERLDCGSWFADRYRSTRIPTIEAMLDSLNGRAHVFFDVKPGANVADLVKLVRSKGYTNRSFFWFAKEDMLREFVAIAPEMAVKVNASDIARLEYWQTICRPAIVEIHVDKLTADFLDYCHKRRIKVMVGAQGESIDDYRKAIETGADMINLDKPELFEKIISDIKPVTVNISKYGAVNDGKTLCTLAIQRAIDAVAKHKGGGRVVIGAGRWLTGMIELKSNVELFLCKDALLLGSTNPYDYDRASASTQHSIPNTSHPTPHVQMGIRKDEDVHQALIVSNNAHNISIHGQGIIDAQGLALALAIDSLHHTGERLDPNYNIRRQRPNTRPKLLFLENSSIIDVKGVTFRNSSGWGLSFHKSTGICIDSVTVYNRAYWNNDGIDLNDCKRVSITHSDVNSADDGICLKSDDANSCCRDVTIAHCRIASSASAVKFGTSSYGGFRNVKITDIDVYDTFRSAIALESVDGGRLENIVVDGVNAVNTGNPLFIRLGARHGINSGGNTEKGFCSGTCRDVVICNMKCQVPFGRPDEAYDLRGPEVNYFHNPWPSSICGLPGHNIENITLEDIDITYPGRATKGMAYMGLYRANEVPEVADAYPEFSMFGELPSWAFYIRHVNGINMRNINVKLAESDFRPAFVFDDVQNKNLEGINLPDNQIYEVRNKEIK